jgi:hypothetical protein
VATIRRRRAQTVISGSDIRHRGNNACPVEAFEYEDDITPDAVKQLRDEADRAMPGAQWTVVEGYVGNKENSSLAR